MDQHSPESAEHFSHPILTQLAQPVDPKPFPPPPVNRSGVWIATTLLLLFAVVPAVGYTGYQVGLQSATAASAPNQPATGNGQPIKHWEGSENQQTELFTVSAEWRILWSDNIADSTGGLFTLELDTSAGQTVGLVANSDHTGQAIYYVHAKPGTFYLKMEAVYASYTVDVQVLK